MTTIIEKLNDRQKVWLAKGTEIWSGLQGRSNGLIADLQERREQVTHRGQTALAAGQKAIGTFQVTVLGRVADVLNWAYATTGEKSAALKRGAELVTARAESASETTVVGPPLDGYDEMSAKALVARAPELDETTLASVRTYEAANKARKTVLAAVEAALSNE
jgi:hypothetical protein